MMTQPYSRLPGAAVRISAISGREKSGCQTAYRAERIIFADDGIIFAALMYA